MADTMIYSLSIFLISTFVEALFVEAPGHVPSVPSPKSGTGNTSKAELKCVCLNARSIINKKNELDIMGDEIKPHIIGITESWANNDITDAELGLEGYVMLCNV